METTPPLRTAGELTQMDGTRVWIQTLNTLQKEDADKRARRYAQNECRPLRKDGDDYAAMNAEIFALSAQQQAIFIADDSYWPIHEEALTLHPEPQEPEQGELSAADFTEAHIAWEEECVKAEQARRDHEAARFDEIYQLALRLSNRARRERCADVYFTKEFIKAYTRRMKYETLWRAVRNEEDRLQRYYPSVEAVEDADDATQSALWTYYTNLDVAPNMIPTSPAQS
jgi:hypothetical protein